MFNDLSSIFYFWFILLAIGIVFLPVTFKIFTRFADGGYIFAKTLGLALTTYLLWLLSSLHLLPFSTLSILLVLLLAIVINLFITRKFTKEDVQKIKSRWRIMALEELIFLSALLFWAYVRAHEPSVHGLEKFMDYGFISSILKSDFFPPKDIWLTPKTINYYYFGHLATAVLTKLSDISPAVAFNLMLSAIFAFTFAGAFSIGMNLFAWRVTQDGENESAGSRPPLTGSILCGLLSAFLVTLGGNLHPIYAFLRGFDKYWYPDATRYIPYTIHEFPSYSWVVADLHGHVLDIPFVLLTIALIFALLIAKPQKKSFAAYSLLISLMLAIMYMTNAWDGMIYLILSILAAFILCLKPTPRSSQPQVQNPVRRSGGQNYSFKLKVINFKFQFYAFRFGLFVLLILAGFFLFSLPFNLHFKPFASGLYFVRDRSPLYMLVILWGFFYFSAGSFGVFLFKTIKSKQIVNLAVSDLLVLIFILLSTVLLIFPEIFYVKDIYPLHYRANTMFKLGYQAFIMLSFSSAYIFMRILTFRKNLFTLFFFCLSVLLFIPVAIYPYFAIKSYYGNLKNYQSLDGLDWLKKQYPSDYRAILWLRENVADQPVILEAVGESYTDYARVSSFTGLPTVVGWPVHEWLWRGSYDEAGKRDAEVRRAYETQDLTETRYFLQKYKVQYVFAGTLERQKYPGADFAKWAELGQPIFRFNQTVIYQIPKN